MDEIQIVPESDFGRKRIGVLCFSGLESFIKPIVTHFEDDYAVRTCYSNSLPELGSVVDWADLVWIEWCNELAIELTNKLHVLEQKKVIIRLHSYEALSGYVRTVNWNVVDHLVFVAEHIREIVLRSFPNLKNIVPITVVHNGV
jgi:hypothetical protein